MDQCGNVQYSHSQVLHHKNLMLLHLQLLQFRTHQVDHLPGKSKENLKNFNGFLEFSKPTYDIRQISKFRVCHSCIFLEDFYGENCFADEKFCDEFCPSGKNYPSNFRNVKICDSNSDIW